MKFKRSPTPLIFGLGLILALALPLFARREAQAMPLPGQIENSAELLLAGAWDKIQSQLQLDQYELALASAGAVNGTSDPLVGVGADPLIFFQIAKLTASDGADNDFLGYSVAISGETVVVGAHGADSAGDKSGVAYIFERNQGGADNWGQVKKLTASDAAAGDAFGVAVAIDGDTIIVGAVWKDGAGLEWGAAYVFERNQGGVDNWGQVKKLTASDAEDVDWFGSAVAINGDTVVVGAYYEDGFGSDRGAAYVFERDQGGADNWGQAKKLSASDAADYDGFGRSVAISGDTIVAGASFENGAGTFRGAAYVFERDQGGAGSWGQVKKLTASDGADYDLFGLSVTISGDTIIVGAPRKDDAGSDRGAAYVFERNQGGVNSWGQVKKLTAADSADNDWFGDSLALNGDTVMVGADWQNSVGSTRGAAYVFQRNQDGAENWGQFQKLTASDTEDNDFFGRSVALSGNTLIVGAPQEDGLGGDRGAAYIFSLQPAKYIYLPLVVENQ